MKHLIALAGWIAEHKHNRHRTTQEQQAYRTALREATDAHLSRCQCRRTDCPRTT